MKFKKYDVNKDIIIENLIEESNIGKAMDRIAKEVIRNIREQIIDESVNEMLNGMKDMGIENIDKYILNVIDERVIIESARISISTRYDSNQVVELNEGYKSLSKEEFDVIEDNKIKHEEMKIMRESIEEGLPLEKLKMIDASVLSKDSIVELKKAIKDELNMEELSILIETGEKSGLKGIELIRGILDRHGIAKARFASCTRFSLSQQNKISEAFDTGIGLEAAKNLLIESANGDLMGLIIKGIVDYNIKEEKIKKYRDVCVGENLAHKDSLNLLQLISKGVTSDVYA